nr:hypothetical protein [Candidatus Woesebacteria bacterium]
SFVEFKTARMHARGRREDQRWGLVHQRIGQDITDQGYAIEYWMRPPIEPDQIDWLGQQWDPPLERISTSTMRVYWCRKELIPGLRENQEKGDDPLSVDGLAARITPHFYHQDIGDLTSRRHERLAGLEIRLPADAIALYKELEALSVDAQESPLEISQGLAGMLSQIEVQILPHVVDSLSEVRSLLPSGEAQ